MPETRDPIHSPTKNTVEIGFPMRSDKNGNDREGHVRTRAKTIGEHVFARKAVERFG